jgi:hypothetical protein
MRTRLAILCEVQVSGDSAFRGRVGGGPEGIRRPGTSYPVVIRRPLK